MTKTYKPQFRRITRTIAWLLILTLVTNFAGVFVSPQKAKAVDVSDYMLLFWPSTNCADTPTGWTAVSDGVGEDFYQKFPRGAASYATGGGSNTHTHAATVTTPSMSSASARKSGAAGITGSSVTHTMGTNSASVDSPTVLPKYGEMCVIKYDNGIPNGNSAIPDQAVAIFDAAVPAGWSDYSSTFSAASDTFIRGGTNGTGGSNSHGGTTLAITSISLTAPSGTATSATSTGSFATTSHTHTVANQVSDTPDTQPPYRNIYLGRKSSAGAIPNGMIAMFQDTDSSVGFTTAGWTRLSDGGGDFNNRFLKVTGTYGGTGGATTHHHADINTTSATFTPDGATATNGSSGPAYTHVHNVTIALADGTNTNLPAYTDVVIAKKQTVTTTLTTDSGSYPTLGETISISTTVNNYHASTNLSNTYIDAVIFEDTVTADGKPTANETYITNGCAGSAAWASGNYTHQNTTVSVTAGSSANDNWTCSNANFPDNTTYTLWTRWWDGTSYGYNIYYEKSVTFTSVPTLTEILFMVLVGCAVFLAVKSGAINLKLTKPEPMDEKPPQDIPPVLPNTNHQRSIDETRKIPKEKS